MTFDPMKTALGKKSLPPLKSDRFKAFSHIFGNLMAVSMGKGVEDCLSVIITPVNNTDGGKKM